MSREKRQANIFFLNRQITYFYSVYDDPVSLKEKITEPKIWELFGILNEKRESRIYENTIKAILIEKFLVDIYEIYKKNPKDYNKLIELEKKKNYPFVFDSKLKIINNYYKLKLIWDSFITFPKLSFFSFNSYFSSPQSKNNGIISDPDELEKILEIRKKFLSFLESYYPYPFIEIEINTNVLTQTTPVEKDNTDLKYVSLNKMSGNTIKNPNGGLVLKVIGFDKFKKLRNRYKPNSQISDFELNEFIASELNKDPTFNFEEYLKLEAKAWEDFRRRYPYSDAKSFSGEYFNHSYNIYYKHTPIEVIGDNPASSFYDNVKAVLSPPGSFPFTLLRGNSKYPNLGTPYNKKPAAILNEFEISVSSNQSFLAKFRNIFKNTTITFGSAAQSRRWLQGPNMNYWPQQLNFAVWCATSGCGISLNEDYPKRVQQFIIFHVYFTIRRLLYEMGVALPGKSIFRQVGNHYNLVAFQKLCQEFNLPANPDFRYKGGMNHGLGTIYIKDGGSGRWLIPPVSNGLVVWPNRSPIFSDEHGIGGQVGRIVNISHKGKQYEWFSPFSGAGITKAGMGRLNRSVEAFVYCIVGAEVNIRSSIVDSGGGGQETQQEMLKIFEDGVIEEDIASGAQRYQLVIQEAKLQLNFAIAPSVWLIPSNLIINTESVVGYNNNLKKANNLMTFGLNQTINNEIKQVGVNHSLGNNKVSLPHTAVHYKKQPVIAVKPINHDKVEKVKPVSKIKTKSETQNHDLNKNIIMITAAGIGWWLFR